MDIVEFVENICGQKFMLREMYARYKEFPKDKSHIFMTRKGWILVRAEKPGALVPISEVRDVPDGRVNNSLYYEE